MSMKCKRCNYEMTTFEFLGHMTAEVFLILKSKLQTRSVSEGWSCFMAGFADKMQITCPVCEKFQGWLPATWQQHSANSNKEQNHVE